MFKQKYIINTLFIGMIVLLGWQIFTIEPKVHAEEYSPLLVEGINRWVESGGKLGRPDQPAILQTEPIDRVTAGTEAIRLKKVQAAYPYFNKQPQFDAVLPKPEPIVEPPPPPAAPELAKAVGDWRLIYVIGDEALFQHTKTQKDFTIKLGESHKAAYGQFDVSVTLFEADEASNSASVKLDGYGDQTHTF